MIVPIPRSQRTSEENVLPLINIVFLLLIFFMIAGALSTTAPFPLHPPQTGAADATEAPRDGIAIGAEGQLAFAGEEIQLDDLSERIEAWQVRAEPGDLLAVRAHEEAGTGALLQVMGVLRESGIDTIRLLSIGDPGES